MTRAINNIPKPAQDAIIATAMEILESRLKFAGFSLSNPDQSKQYLIGKLAHLEHEVFAVLYLNNRHCVIKYDEPFRGTINAATVHPRELVKAALYCNAAALVIAHNHPSGVPEPSTADINLTEQIKAAMSLIDIRLLDHIIVGGFRTVSFAERGLI